MKVIPDETKRAMTTRSNGKYHHIPPEKQLVMYQKFRTGVTHKELCIEYELPYYCIRDIIDNHFKWNIK